ncbi:MAG: hypothetical protein ACI31U_05160, partial [Lactobacillus crispatus]
EINLRNHSSLHKLFYSLEELANIPDLGIYVIVTNFYKAYFQGNKKKSQQILDFLNQNGLSEISSRLP